MKCFELLPPFWHTSPITLGISSVIEMGNSGWVPSSLGLVSEKPVQQRGGVTSPTPTQGAEGRTGLSKVWR